MYKILLKINLASKILHLDLILENAVDLLKNTMENMGKIRDNINILIEETNSKALLGDVTLDFSCKRTRKVKKLFDELCQVQCLSQGNHYFETQDSIAILTLSILRLTVISDDQISENAKQLADKLQYFNPAELTSHTNSVIQIPICF
ncbi:Hypothetical protein CINCED_3A011994 [Cinara cedri]|uniref:Uncharacterized protein n=1 Tax=Cinara cedri TaxID=506608 RepID=A0A5E4N1U3_9HEMI|nr:Hypothetical protein CINCED_3A011994 [Cinara cedri]